MVSVPHQFRALHERKANFAHNLHTKKKTNKKKISVMLFPSSPSSARKREVCLRGGKKEELETHWNRTLLFLYTAYHDFLPHYLVDNILKLVFVLLLFSVPARQSFRGIRGVNPTHPVLALAPGPISNENNNKKTRERPRFGEDMVAEVYKPAEQAHVPFSGEGEGGRRQRASRVASLFLQFEAIAFRSRPPASPLQGPHRGFQGTHSTLVNLNHFRRV